MQNLTVQCPECSLRVVDVDHPDVVYERDANGNVLCPNCHVPTKPVGVGAVMHAEEAFKEANRELAGDIGACPMPPTETTETLTKRLREIELARTRVVDAQSRYDTKRDAAKEAKKHLDDETTSFITLVGRLAAVPAVLPLFSQEAEAAASDVAVHDLPDDPDAVWHELVAAGFMAATVEQIRAWSVGQRDQARTWARGAGTVESLPTFMEDLVTAPEGQVETTTA